MRQVSPAKNVRRSASMAEKAIVAMGAGILAAGLGASFPFAIILGCVAGYVFGHWAEKKERENAARDDV